MTTINHIRNIAIIAHVDHGKTTLVDEMLHQSGTFRENEQVDERAMDKNDIEKERGITILAKNTALKVGDHKINILDTPGHADFGGEVERIMSLVDGVLLVVDAYEGCMPQTRFVLKKAFEQNLAPIVVVNKIDKPQARPKEVVDEVLDLFIELGADEDQIDFPVVYASGIQGKASFEPELPNETIDPLFDVIIDKIPAPEHDEKGALQFQIALLDYNDYVGRIGIGRIFRGEMSVGDRVSLIKKDGTYKSFRISKLFGFQGLERVEIEHASAGDLVAVAGLDDINVGETVCPEGEEDPLPLLHIDEPTLQMTFLVNNSPFAGQEGDHVTSRKIEARLREQLETDVSLRVEETESPDRWVVSGRGELHLSILLENLRREGFELQVSKPQVIRKEIDGVISEPYESVQIDVPDEYTGAVMEGLGARKGEMIDMVHQENGQVRMYFQIPSRGLIGYRNEFLSQTRGYGMMNHTFDCYKPEVKETIGGRRQGALIAKEAGQVTSYSLQQLEDRGTMFVEPGTKVYEGMVVGEHTRDNDLSVNVTKEKHVTNIRSANKDQTVTMKKPRILTLEEALQFLDDDEYCEITPEFIRLRKQILNTTERERAEKRKKLNKTN